MKVKDHVGNLESFTWDSEACVASVNSLPDDATLNYSALARQFNVLNANGT